MPKVPLNRHSWLATLPGIAVSLLPSVTCPACWPAYAGLLSSLGIGFLVINTSYLLPLTIASLVVALIALGFRSRRGVGPFLTGLLAALLIVVGKFVVDTTIVMYGGVVLLIAASLWNAWPRRAMVCDSVPCPACSPTTPPGEAPLTR